MLRWSGTATLQRAANTADGCRQYALALVLQQQGETVWTVARACFSGSQRLKSGQVGQRFRSELVRNSGRPERARPNNRPAKELDRAAHNSLNNFTDPKKCFRGW